MHILPSRHHPLLIAALTLLLYAGTLNNAFVLDDHAAIRDNPIVHRADLSEIFTTDYWSGYHADRSGLYRPLTILSYALQYRLGGDAPFGYHLLNILLHTTTALLLYRLVVDLTEKNDIALATALLFAVHPAISEAVCTAVGRADLLAAALTALSLILHLRRKTTGATIALLLALLCKENAIVGLALFALTDVFQYRTFSRKSYRKPYLIYTGAILAYLLWRYHVLGALGLSQIDRLDNPLIELEPGLRLLNAAALLGRYLGLLALPGELSADYSYAALPLATQFLSPHLAQVLLGLVLLPLTLVYSWHRHPRLCFGLAWTLLCLAPVANILLPIGTIMAERLLYLPAFGFCFGLAALLHKVQRNTLVLIALIALFSLRTAFRVADWQDSYTLFSSATRTHPQSARAWRVLGKAHFQRGEDQQGLSALNQALQIFPDYYEIYNDLGTYHIQVAQYDRAFGNLEASLRINAKFPPTWLNMGLAFYHLQHKEEAQQAFEQALRLAPAYSQAIYNLGVLSLEKGEKAKAGAFFSRVLELEPYHSEARQSLDRLQSAQ